MKKILDTINTPTCCDRWYADITRGTTHCSLLKKYTVCPPEDGKFPKDCPLEDYEE